MLRVFSKADLTAVSSMLALMLLLSSVPLNSGVVLVTGPNHPQLTLNICRPIQDCSCASNNLLARPAVNAPQFVLTSMTSLAATPAARLVERAVPPDTPPPKYLV
jgi:hypothetical protein